jgi:hypothetical protein
MIVSRARGNIKEALNKSILDFLEREKRKCDFSFFYIFQLLAQSENGGTFRLHFLLRRKVRGRLLSARSRQCREPLYHRNP